MIAINTKYLPPTNTLGSRIKAKTDTYSVTIPRDYSKNDLEMHFAAVKALTKKHYPSWNISTMVYGSSNNGCTYHFCFPHSIVNTML